MLANKLTGGNAGSRVGCNFIRFLVVGHAQSRVPQFGSLECKCGRVVLFIDFFPHV